MILHSQQQLPDCLKPLESGQVCVVDAAAENAEWNMVCRLIED